MGIFSPLATIGTALSSNAAGGLMQALSLPLKVAGFGTGSELARHSIDRYMKLGDPSTQPTQSLDQIFAREPMQRQVYQQQTEGLNRQRGIADTRTARLQSGGKAQMDLFERTIANPNILSQRSIDQLVAKQIEANNAASASRLQALEDRAAATGQAGMGLSESRRLEGEGNASANSIAARDVELTNALQSAQRQDEATRQLAQFRLGLEQLLGQSEAQQMALAPDVSLQPFIDRDFAMREQARQEARAAMGFLTSLLMGQAGELFGQGQDIVQRNRELDAIRDSQSSGVGEILGPSIGGGLGLTALLTAGGGGAGTALGIGKMMIMCIDADAMIDTTTGQKRLRDVQIGDWVMQSDSTCARVVGKDLGPPHPDNNRFVKLGPLRLTDTHTLDGIPAGELSFEYVESPELCGDLEVEGGHGYFANGIYVDSMFAKVAV